MASSISSLGMGSGILTADVIDQLKVADEARIVKPIEKKITSNKQKQEAYQLLDSLMKSFKASASALSYDTIFDNKAVEVDGGSDVTVDSGATAESFSVETVELAKKDITKFGAFSDKDATPVASGPGTLKINDFEIPYDETTTLRDLAQAITEEAGKSISVSILQTGEGMFSLVLATKDTGADQALNIRDSSDPLDSFLGIGALSATLLDPVNATTNPNGYEKVQEASDADFKYNGITTTRKTNEISDLILGVNLKLNKEGDVSKVDISRDTESITGELQLFVDSYNTLITNLKDMTSKDKETGAQGVFNGDSFVKSISRELRKTLTSLDNDNNSLSNYGIDIDRYGTMSFNQNTLQTKMDQDPQAVKVYFTGGKNAKGYEVTGMFEKIDDKLKSYTGYGKLLSNYESNLKTEGKNLSENHEKALASLEDRYAIMTKRFGAYDSVISGINSQFSGLKMMIDAESNS